mgnify:CR=1 FL=1
MENIRQKIASKGLKHRYIADKIGIHFTALSQYLNGHRPMPEEVEERIKKLLN